MSSESAKSCGKTPVPWAPKIVPVSPATPAPNMNAISFKRFTGMPIASAASGSSRSARQARPVRDSLTKWSAARTTTKKPSAT